MTQTFDIHFIRILWVLNLLPNEDLPRIAADAINNGYYTESLLKLVALPSEDSFQSRNLFARFFIEIGETATDKADALRRYARFISNQILTFELLPIQGAKKIWHAKVAGEVSDCHDIDPFIYAASEWEDRPEDRSFFEKAVIDEARRWVSGTNETTGRIT